MTSLIKYLALVVVNVVQWHGAMQFSGILGLARPSGSKGEDIGEVRVLECVAMPEVVDAEMTEVEQPAEEMAYHPLERGGKLTLLRAVSPPAKLVKLYGPQHE